MPYQVVTPVHVEIDEVPLSTPAWENTNPMELRQGPATRGTDRLVPGAAGVLPGQRRAAPARRLLEIIVRGHVDWEGNPYTDLDEGLDANLMHLRDHVTDPVGDPREGVLFLPDGSTVAGLIHVESFEWSYWGPDAKGAIDITVLPGSFFGGGS